MLKLTYRNASLEDLPEIVRIYNSTIPSAMVTADTKEVTLESKLSWFHAHNNDNRPLWTVINAGEIIGWASFQNYHDRPAYKPTAEISIYVSDSHRGKGYGKEILQYCIDYAPSHGIKTFIALIFAHNIPSLNLFYGAGFEKWGELPNITELHGIERTVCILGKRVG